MMAFVERGSGRCAGTSRVIPRYAVTFGALDGRVKPPSRPSQNLSSRPSAKAREPGPVAPHEPQDRWVPALAEPVIGPRFARTRWLGRDDKGGTLYAWAFAWASPGAW